ncbi:hypothetical protein PGQ11_006191 [Apiospora arundinis]|uniref:Uncharacterized protein n=1 Tax=Apiospora arundinis TaxID=335852 RepID=A0ABR2IRZ0_9PEZI
MYISVNSPLWSEWLQGSLNIASIAISRLLVRELDRLQSAKSSHSFVFVSSLSYVIAVGMSEWRQLGQDDAHSGRGASRVATVSDEESVLGQWPPGQVVTHILM